MTSLARNLRVCTAIIVAVIALLSDGAAYACKVNGKDRTDIRRTSSLRTYAPGAEVYPGVHGCALVTIDVAPDGTVTLAKVLQHHGSGVGVWRGLAMGQRYMPQNAPWVGVVEFLSVASSAAAYSAVGR
jgi:hypothetical protein